MTRRPTGVASGASVAPGEGVEAPVWPYAHCHPRPPLPSVIPPLAQWGVVSLSGLSDCSVGKGAEPWRKVWWKSGSGREGGGRGRLCAVYVRVGCAVLWLSTKPRLPSAHTAFCPNSTPPSPCLLAWRSAALVQSSLAAQNAGKFPDIVREQKYACILYSQNRLWCPSSFCHLASRPGAIPWTSPGPGLRPP